MEKYYKLKMSVKPLEGSIPDFITHIVGYIKTKGALQQGVYLANSSLERGGTLHTATGKIEFEEVTKGGYEMYGLGQVNAHSKRAEQGRKALEARV